MGQRWLSRSKECDKAIITKIVITVNTGHFPAAKAGRIMGISVSAEVTIEDLRVIELRVPHIK